MSELGLRIYDFAATLGGTLALMFIIALASGLVAMFGLFAGAAVVVLERFARLARRPLTVALLAAPWSVAAALVLLDVGTPGVLSDPASVGRVLTPAIAGSAGAVCVCVVVLWVALRRLAPRTLGGIALGLLAVGVALFQGAVASAGAALVPAALAGVAAVALAVRSRRARPPTGLGVAARVGLAAVVLAAAPLFGTLSFDARQATASLGAGVLGLLGALLVLGLAPLAAAGFVGSRGSPEWFIAVRYLFAKRGQTFISVITAICVAGVAAGVWLIITVMSVMNGFDRTWREEIIGNRAHFTVLNGLGSFADYDDVLANVLASPDIEAASPYIDAEGMVRGEHGRIVGVRVHGVDPERIGQVTDLAEDMISGSLEALGRPRDSDSDGEPLDPGIVIGSELASALGLQVGDPMLVISPFGGPPTPLGAAPRLSRFQVVGVFRSSFFQYDEIFTYVGLEAAQDFRRAEDVVDGIEVRTTDYYRSAHIAEGVGEALGFPFYTRDWKEYFPAFFQALKTERVMMFILLTMIMVVAAFAIVVTLVMMIMEKASDIAILKAMGARDETIERVFAIEGALIGLVGTAIGVIAGIAVTMRLDWIQNKVEEVIGIDALPASVYQGVSELPAELDPVQIAAVVGIAMALSLGGTLIPSQQGARLDPAESLRYE